MDCTDLARIIAIHWPRQKVQQAGRLLCCQSLHVWLTVQAPDSGSPGFGSFSPQQWSPGQQWTPSPAWKTGVSAFMPTALITFYSSSHHGG